MKRPVSLAGKLVGAWVAVMVICAPLAIGALISPVAMIVGGVFTIAMAMTTVVAYIEGGDHHG